MYSGLNSHVTYKKSSLIRISRKLSAGSAVCRNPPGTLYMSTYLCYIISKTKVFISDLVENVGEYTISSGFRYFLCFLPFAHVLTLIFPQSFSLIKFTASNVFFLYSGVSLLGLKGATTSVIDMGTSSN